MPGPSPLPRTRAILGLTWATRGLLGFVVATLLTAVGLLALVPLYGLPTPPSAYRTAQLEDSLVVLSAAVLLVGFVSGLLYCVGLAGLYGPRHELGREHATSVGQTTLWLGLLLVLLAPSLVVASLTGPLLGIPGIGYTPPSWAWSASVVLAGLRAIFAGLTLYYAVQGLAEEDERVRLLVGMTLGVAGGIVWSGLAAYAGGIGGPSMDSLLPFLAGIIGGLGTSAISLLLFVFVYRDIRRDLEARPSETG